MEGLLIIGIFIYVGYLLMGDNCDHDWIYYNDIHKCVKCGKEEKHDYQWVEKDAWADKNIDTYTVRECSICGANGAWDND